MLTHQASTNDGKCAPEQIPGHVKAHLGHECSIEQAKKNHYADERQQTYGGGKWPIAADKLKIEWNVECWNLTVSISHVLYPGGGKHPQKHKLQQRTLAYRGST